MDMIQAYVSKIKNISETAIVNIDIGHVTEYSNIM